MEDLHALEEWAGALLGQLQPPARRQAMGDIARELRRSQQKRIAEQRNPSGAPFTPRKNQASKKLRGKAGRIKRRAMFAKLRTARFLKFESNAEGLAIGFAGQVARLAKVHQEGQSAPVGPGIEYKYPVRKLLGFTEQERQMIRDKLIDHLAK